MKKNKKIFLFFYLTLFFFLPLISFSVDFNVSKGPAKCCVIQNRITINNKTCNGNTIVAATSGDIADCGNLNYCTSSADYWASFCVINSILLISKYLFYGALILSTLFILYSAILMVVSFGDPQKFNQGKTVLIFALLGMGIALIGKWLPNIVGFFMGLDVKI